MEACYSELVLEIFSEVTFIFLQDVSFIGQLLYYWLVHRVAWRCFGKSCNKILRRYGHGWRGNKWILLPYSREQKHVLLFMKSEILVFKNIGVTNRDVLLLATVWYLQRNTMVISVTLSLITHSICLKSNAYRVSNSYPFLMSRTHKSMLRWEIICF